MVARRNERVDRLLNRTFNHISLQKAERAASTPHDNTIDFHVSGEQESYAKGTEPETATPTISTVQSQPRAHLLHIPFELRIEILKHVLKPPGQSFLSSRQQVTASYNEFGCLSSTSALLSSSPNELLPDNSTRPQHPNGHDTSRTEMKSIPTRFTHPSHTFRSYAESRHADTSILYVCRQLRSEGLPLYHSHKYYLTLVLEQGHYPPPVRLLVDMSARRRSSAGSTHSTSTSSNPRRSDTRTLQFDQLDQPRFWNHVRTDLRFPDLATMKRFRKFHVSLFIEESAFAGVDAWRGVGGQTMSVNEIVRVLTGGHHHQDNALTTIASSTQAGLGNDDHLTCTCQKNNLTAGISNAQQESHNDDNSVQVKFLDHTYLGLAHDAAYDNHDTPRSVDGADGETSLSLSVEMWRV